MLPNRIQTRTGAAGARVPPRENFIRCATAHVAAAARNSRADLVLRSIWPGDEVTPALLQRAAVDGATTTTPAWAGALVEQSVLDFMVSIGPASAAAQILRAGLVVNLDDLAFGTRVPGFVPQATAASFVGETAPIPVVQFTGSVLLEPRKLASIAVFSREMAMRSNVETFVRQALTESVGLALDAALFGTAAADVAPAGLLHDVTPLTAATGGDDGAMVRDLGALAAAVAPVGGDAIAFVASPDAAAKIRLRANPAFAYPVFSSSALAAGTVLAVAVNAIAAGFGPRPQIDASRDATVHMDTTPTQIADDGVVASPTVGMFQTGNIALRVMLDAGWGVRAPGAVAHVTGATW